MKVKRILQIIGLVGLTFSILGCQSETKNSPVIESVNINKKINSNDVIFLDENLYKDTPEYKTLISLINQAVQKFNNRDKEGFLDLFNDPKSYAPVYNHLAEEENRKVMKVSNPVFNKENDLVTVSVDQEYLDQQKDSKEYSFIKVGNTWKIIFID